MAQSRGPFAEMGSKLNIDINEQIDHYNKDSKDADDLADDQRPFHTACRI